ncbi:hypothetical protein P8935_09745 [Telmatobacter sp. DSM 110680]|uniref:Uncharacterized protein n=1 Tax=Telmatobacter sp. DSM 110680 TaxID=3036704 RepID=A0AAU7DP54_9BACT
MSFGSPISPFDPDGEYWWSKGSSGLTQQISGVGHFLRGFRTRLRFGLLSREPLRLIRFQITDQIAECDWIARNQDVWDEDLAREIGRRHASLQALKDAIDVRSMLFEVLPDLATARLRVYRESNSHPRELIIAGNVRRQDGAFRSIHSLAMRAKLVGLRFCLENDLLCRLPREEKFGFGD